MAFLSISLRWKIVFPVTLATAAAISFFGHYTVQEFRRTLDYRERNNLRLSAFRLSKHNGTISAVKWHQGEPCKVAFNELIANHPSYLSVQLWALNTDNEYELLHEKKRSDEVNLPLWEPSTLKGASVWQFGEQSGFLMVGHINTELMMPGKISHDGVDPLSIDENLQPKALLAIWASREQLNFSVMTYVQSVLPVGLAMLFLALGVVFLVSVRFTNQLQRMTTAAEILGLGSHDVRIEVKGNDEMASLATSFNVMSEKLDSQRQEIEDYNRTLEQKVEERTVELRRAYEELMTLDRAKDSFLSSVSHELRTPLTSIRSFAEILLDYGQDESPDTRTEFLTIIKSESERLTRHINQVLDLAKIEAGRMAWEISTFDFVEIVKIAVRVQSGLTAVKQVEFVTCLPDEPLLYTGDRDKVHQVLVNLISNAWKFSPEGEIVHVDLMKTDGGLELRISDRGPGVDGESAKKAIFDKFRQIGDTLTDKPEGTGLGLPISKEIVRMHGGIIACEDNPGGGAVFVVMLPNHDPEAKRPLEEAVEQQENSSLPPGLNADPSRSLFKVKAVT